MLYSNNAKYLTAVGQPWFCSTECEFENGRDDYVQNYSLRVLSRGLLHLANRDAIREGDGLALLTHWRLNMLDFWKKHPKYFRLGHMLLACKFYFKCASVEYNVITSRTSVISMTKLQFNAK